MIIHSPGHPDYNPSQIVEKQLTAGYVYLIAPIGHNVYKIGISTNPQRRLETIQRKFMCQLEIVAMIWYEDYEAAERHFHKKYAGYRLGLNVEWFALPDSEVEYIKGLAS